MNPTCVHMIGIGGVGMSALAQLYAHRGVRVSGTDRSPSPLTELLRARGIAVQIGHDAEAIPLEVDMVVYSDAVPAENPERVCAEARGVRTCSYFEALGEATRDGVSVVVSGTHGKTTTTAMLAQILSATGREPTVIAGSILSHEGSNFVAGRDDLFVIEGCEYRRHFLHLHPHVLVITNIELDHTDYYRDSEDLYDAFRTIAHRVPAMGVIVADLGMPEVAQTLEGASARRVSYADMSIPALQVPGEFNRANARAAKATVLALFPDTPEGEINQSLSEFRGTWRRFEYRGKMVSGALVYDDYAHHPTAVSATLNAARVAFPERRIVVAFHPHLYSRTRDFMGAFASALACADEVLLVPIYAAREEAIPGVTSDVLAEKVRTHGTPATVFDSLSALEAHLGTSGICTAETLLITMGAGDIYTIADRLVSEMGTVPISAHEGKV